MRILSIHNKYLIKGGEDESRIAETSIMEKNGHDVTFYTEDNDRVKQMSRVETAIKTIWSQESYNKVSAFLKEQKHDIVHIQNFFPLISPSVYYAAKKQKVPVVQAIRNYRLICPSYNLFRDGHVCMDCVGKTIPYPGIVHKCYRENYAASATVSTMLSVHNLLNSWENVDLFICVSEFVKQKLILGGIPANKLCVKPNSVSTDPGVDLQKEDYIVFVGRLQYEKGIITLLNAMMAIGDNSIKLKIVGTGPLLNEVLAYASKNNNIEYLGGKSLEETYHIIGKAKALVIPSIWHEPFGRVVVEAYAKGTPVIGSNMGGITELIKPDETGFLYEADDVIGLAGKITSIFANQIQHSNMMRAARNEFIEKYTPEKNYAMLMDIYNKVK